VSLNLTCKEVPLRQTPTAVTMRAMPYLDTSWATVFAIYLSWLLPDTTDPDDYVVIEDHITALCAAIKTHGRLTFSYI